MSINKQALREAAEKAQVSQGNLMASGLDIFDETAALRPEIRKDIAIMDCFRDLVLPATVLAVLDELEAAEKRIAELEAREETLRPVGIMSEKAFHRLEGSESRFIALWPRPGIYLPRKRPDDGVIVYARTAAGIKGE